ncbi:sodium:solute symporter [Rapidithrix thailandica]|uniref:Sodium:solute symporter n=1 Tax=Rapidithrix thailandica TaxID=413964 RepID=A0AAW9S3T2_9BACT
MSPIIVFSIIFGYFLVLMLLSFLTSRKATTDAFFTGQRQSPWYLVAFGMIGASLSGVTFISVPGEVGNSNWAYFQVVLGNLVGYLLIAFLLIPLYYRLRLVSIYEYLDKRLGRFSYKTGSFFFLLSQTIGASFRLFLVAGVLQLAFFDAYEIPFAVTVFVTILLIWLYTFKGGIKTIVWTDTLQTLFMLTTVGVTLWLICRELDFSFSAMIQTIQENPHSQIFVWEWQSGQNFFKQFIAGAFLTIVMTGLDQNMMQKNLTCRNQKEAQKNVVWFSISFAFSNIFFLSLGVLLYVFAFQKGIALPGSSDDLFAILALEHFSPVAGALFLLGITAAAYSSADSALTALTTSFCVDFLNIEKLPEERQKPLRLKVHIAFSLLMFMVILGFHAFNDESVVMAVFKAAGFTYGPLLGLFVFGMFTKREVKDRFVPWICLISPLLCYVVNANSEAWLRGYKFGFEILVLNGLLTFLGLYIISGKKVSDSVKVAG